MKFSPSNVEHALTRKRSRHQTGKVIGITSRGIFIKTESNRIVFLSSEPYLNPLNINLEPFPSFLRYLSMNEGVSFGDGIICIPTLDIKIRVPVDRLYLTPPPSPEMNSPVDRFEYLKTITSELLNRPDIPKFIQVLTDFLENRVEGSTEDRSLSRFFALSRTSEKKVLEEAVVLLTDFIGEGSGLTPSGDDLVSGYLLAMNRWNPHRWQVDLLESLNQRITASAIQKTTTLSANLIELATSGEADERLIRALDSIFTGALSSAEASKLLTSYGSSSGMDAFCGMGLAIK